MTITLNITSGVSPTTDVLGKPILSLVSTDDSGDSSSDNTTRISSPLNFNAVIPDGYVGVTIELYDGNTLLDSVDTTGAIATFSSVTFPEGTSDPRIRYLQDGLTSPKSDSLSPLLVVDLTAPTLSSATGTKTGSTTATLSISTNTANGTIFWTADTNTTAATAAQVIAGKTAAGINAAKSGSFSVSASGVQSTINLTALGSSLTFKGAFVHRDKAGNISSVSQTGAFTTDAPTQVASSDWWSIAPVYAGNSPHGTYLETTQTFGPGWSFAFFAEDGGVLDHITFDGDAADQTGGGAYGLWAAKYYAAGGSRVVRATGSGTLVNVSAVGGTVNGSGGVTGSSGPTHHPSVSDPQTFASLGLSTGDLGMVIVSSFVNIGVTHPVLWTGVAAANVVDDGYWIAVSEITNTWGTPTASAAGATDFGSAPYGTFVSSLKWSLT